ncbi:MAG: FadD3 family acyl-CoA ligase [Actinobacteria bacterium]|nr:FadD3 family acyl-CoA ligase [Actinomycetota bacterium]
MVRAAGRAFGDREAVVDGDLRLTFGELAARVDDAAAAAIAAGVQPGDRVGIWAPNHHSWIPAALGALAAGGVLVPLNTRYKGREAAHILDRAGARVLFTATGFLDTDYVELLAAAGVSLPELDLIVVLQGEAPATVGIGDAQVPVRTFQDHLAGAESIARELRDERAEAVTPDDISDIMFTSGTTGRPKGVQVTHAQTLEVFEVWSRLVGLREGDRYLIVNPFFHTFGYKAGILAALMRGTTIVPQAVFDADAVMRLVERQRITMLPGPPALYQSILNHGDLGSHDISSLRLAVTGAASIPVSLIERMHEDLGFDTVLTAYGLTEATGVVTMCREGDDPKTIATTSGRAIPRVEVRTVDDAGQDVQVGEPGEVWVRGYNVMQGYLDDPDETARTITDDGWLKTGDIGVLDDRGYLDITDRKKDMFIVGGFNAYPAEIENDLVEHDDVAQAAVVGMPDERLGEVGCAFVIPRAGTSPDPDDLIAWSRERMANFKVPRHVEIVDELPTNASGKVLKHELRDRARTIVSTS